MTSALNRDSRIAVIGAGPSGLSAAWYLQQRGYRQVQVIESEDRVGGKCCSVKVDGRNFDLGAFTVTWGYKQTLALAKETGVPLVWQPERRVFDISAPWIGSIREGLHRKYSMLTLAKVSLRYLLVLFRHRRWLATPGFAGVHEDPELTEYFGDWARKNNLEPLIDMFRLAVKDMGYGSLDEIPTVYIFKYLHFWNFITLGLYTLGMRSWPKRFRFGFERLWTALALPMDVQTGKKITAIKRHGSGVSIQIDGEAQAREYDAVIISCMPDQIAPVMDCNAEEAQLFSAIETTRYSTTLAEVEGMPPKIYNATADDPNTDFLPGHPWEMMRAWPDNDHATFYCMLDDNNGLAEVQDHIRSDLDSLFGAKLKQVVEQREWGYFPHVSQAEMRAGYFDRLEALQGQQHCYYSGGLLAFETVENVVAYSQQLIRKHFPEQY